MYDLDGKVAIITGSGRPKGLGEAMATRLAQEGCKVIIHDIGKIKGEIAPAHGVGTKDDLQKVVASIREGGGEAVGYAADMLIESEVEGLINFAVETYGRLDILINNAGIGYLFGPLIEMTQEQWDGVLGVNLRGCFFGIKHAAKQMIKQGRGGRVVSIASQAAKSGFGNTAAYTSSKHGLVGLTRVAAIELAEHNITVNAICPNHVTTGLGAWQNDFMSKAQGKTEEEYLSDMRGRIPIGRVGLVDDIAKACAFLCSDQADYITAEALNVSGGEEYH
ncbi:MAG: SDR family NAD(P)-dependent oxidoreductase [Rhodospirillaceae bacterium]|nr:SDR family NAD(P)-dependent oxidoreductase [Rhodospirillaceae bacterium]